MLLALLAPPLAADCDSAPEALLLLEDVQYATESIPDDRLVALEGVLKYVYSPQNFMIQVSSL